MNAEDLFFECKYYVSELKERCVHLMRNREYSQTAKYPFKLMSFINSMNWRMYETARAAILLMENNLVLPSLGLVRACWENMAVTYELMVLVRTCCEKSIIDDSVDVTLMRAMFSNRYEKGDQYVSAEHYEAFKDYRAKNILTLIQKVEKDYPETKNFYSNLCEFVHPNGDGVVGSYSQLDEVSDMTFFGPQINTESPLFPAFITTLSCAVSLYLSFEGSITANMSTFAGLCEINLKQ